MAVSRNSGHSGNGSVSYRFGAVSRYDLLLAAIPLLLVLGLTAGVALPVPLHFPIGGSALLGCLFVADALYVNPPTDPADRS